MAGQTLAMECRGPAGVTNGAAIGGAMPVSNNWRGADDGR